MNVRPLNDRLIVEVIEEEKVTKGGIVLPDVAREKPQRGTVLAVGHGVEDPDVRTGDEVLFSRYGGTEFKLPDGDVLILRESDILGVIDGN